MAPHDFAPIPFLDLVTPHQQLEHELLEVLRRALQTAGFVGGPMIEEFEQAFAGFCHTSHCAAVGNGTDALRFALMAAGIKHGDVAITVPNTFIATTEAISQAGALPEFVDIDEHSYNLSASALEHYLATQCRRDDAGRLISLRSGRPVTAVVPVHLYGQVADMDSILRLARQYGLLVIEDACQAHGAEYFSKEQNRWLRAGSIGNAAAFSFYPGKNLGACGEGGAVTSNDPNLIATVKMLRDHGQVKKYHHDLEGYNGRLDAIQAGFLSVKLPYLEGWNQQRRTHANQYRRLLANQQGIVLPSEPEQSRPVYHLYVVRVSDRDGFMRFLKDKGIGTAIHYPIPLHLQSAYAERQYRAEDLPVASRVAGEIVSLPMFPQLRPEQLARVAEAIRVFFATDSSKPLDDGSPSSTGCAAER